MYTCTCTLVYTWIGQLLGCETLIAREYRFSYSTRELSAGLTCTMHCTCVCKLHKPTYPVHKLAISTHTTYTVLYHKHPPSPLHTLLISSSFCHTRYSKDISPCMILPSLSRKLETQLFATSSRATPRGGGRHIMGQS